MSDSDATTAAPGFGVMDGMYLLYHMVMCFAMKSCDGLGGDVDAWVPSFIAGFMKPMIMAYGAPAVTK